jgi:gliding motility-associated protein GldM
MAGGKLSPRQKMINMMYLVLTALLALNVSKEIINAFVTIDEGITASNQNVIKKNQQTIDAFATAMQADAVKAKPYQEKALAVTKASNDLYKFIADTKDEILKKADKIEGAKKMPASSREIEKNDDYDTPTLVMCGDKNDGKGHKASELKKRLEDFKVTLLKQVDDPKEKANFQSRFDELINVKDPDPKSKLATSENKKTWEMATFYHTPVVAAMALLSKIQSDVKTAESQVNNYLLAKINAKDIKFTDVEPKVVAPTSYVLTGQDYKADVFLAAFNKSSDAEIFVGGRKLDVENGMGKYLDRPGSEGVKKWGGVIKVKDPEDPTKVKEYPFEAEYIAAKPAAVISPTKMNVFYIGPENPVSISVPGVPNIKVQPSISGGGGTLTKDPKGSGADYIVKVTTQGEATINITADFDGKKVNMGAQKFRVKRVPNPIAKIGGKNDGNFPKNALLAQSAVIAELENFDFEIYYKVTKFKMSLYRKGKDPVDIEGTGNLINANMKAALGGARAGDKVYFEYIKAVGPDGTQRPVPSVNFTLQ